TSRGSRPRRYRTLRRGGVSGRGERDVAPGRCFHPEGLASADSTLRSVVYPPETLENSCTRVRSTANIDSRADDGRGGGDGGVGARVRVDTIRFRESGRALGHPRRLQLPLVSGGDGGLGCGGSPPSLRAGGRIGVKV